MAAEVESMMFTGEKPWHGLGEYVGDKELNSTEAIKAAKLDWKVAKRPHFIELNNKKFQQVNGIYSLVRETDERIFGDVGPVYHPLQNEDAFKFFDAVVGQKAAMYHTAGSLKMGSKIWILARLNAVMKVTAKDEVEQYLLLTNTHNGKRTIRILCTPIRVVCSNTLAMAIQGADITQQFRIRHTRNATAKFEDIQEKLATANQYFAKVLEASKELAKKQMVAKEIDTFLLQLEVFRRERRAKKLIEDEPKIKMQVALDKVDEEIKGSKEYGKILQLIDSGKGNALPGVHGTAWAAYNGVVEYVDYFMEANEGKSSSNQREARLNSAWFGLGRKTKQQAFAVAMEMAK